MYSALPPTIITVHLDLQQNDVRLAKRHKGLSYYCQSFMKSTQRQMIKPGVQNFFAEGPFS